MALQIWLPLDGNLINNGLSSITVTNHDATVNNSGKIGKCYSFNGNTYYISLVGQALFNCFKGGANPFTICMWVFHGDSRRAILFGDHATTSGVSFNIELSTGHAVRFYWAGNPDYNPSGMNVGASTWHHITFTYDGSILSSYLDGVLKTTRSGTLASLNKTAGEFRLGRDNRTTDTALNGRLNDFRVYDECLSAKQVKEISKGLILHHTLNYRNPNVNSGLGIAPCGNGITSYTNEKYSHHSVWNQGGTARMQNLGFNGRTGPWTVSFDIKSSVNNTINVDICDKAAATSTYGNNLVANQWAHKSYIITTATNQYNTSSNYNGFIDFNVGSACTLDIKNVKLEEGTVETEFCESTYDPSISYDVSGYCHNGTVLNGPLTPAVSPRYQAATKFTATNKKIKISNLQTSQITNSYSFTWWSKQNTFSGTMNWGFSGGVRVNALYNGNLWNTGDSSSNPLYNPGTTTQVTVPTANQWYHWAMIGDGSTCKVYKNGELWAQAKTYKGLSGTELFINGWSSATEYSMSDLTVSDFRLYATALSAADVKELYETSMDIDSSGNILPRSLST